jgi:hypothetical protein
MDYTDVQVEIFKRINLNLETIARCSLVCKRWFDLLLSDQLLESARESIEKERSVTLLGRPDPNWLLSDDQFRIAVNSASDLSIKVTAFCLVYF